ncbi:hypothetical protein SBBP2_2400027 [Burkholderiales bacterium]|nr:hypothetical protein SBBP2_2400027 [Burkholderiales bacterium]
MSTGNTRFTYAAGFEFIHCKACNIGAGTSDDGWRAYARAAEGRTGPRVARRYAFSLTDRGCNGSGTHAVGAR